MTGTTIQAGGVERVAPPDAGARSGPRLRRRHLWLVPGLAIAIVANELGRTNGVGILTLIAFGIAPDLPRLFRARGRLAHNVLHQPLVPLIAIAIAIAATGVVPALWLVGSLVWLGHVLAGRALGDVPRGRGRGADA